MTQLTLDQARTILAQNCDDEHLLNHALAVSAAMGAMAGRFGADKEHWQAVGYLHDVDYQHYPQEHLSHTREILEPLGIDEADIRAILSHGWGICSEVEPVSDLEKSLFTVDELTGIVMANALMRPNGIADMDVKSVNKKFKDKRFAAKCDRDIIRKGCELLDMELNQVIALVIEGMREHMDELGIGPKE